MAKKTKPDRNRWLFDVESDGLLPTLTRIHVLCLKNADTKECLTFRRNDEEDTIEEGLAILAQAAEVIGHNIIGFDLKAIRKVYPDFELDPNCEIKDTLVMVRLLPIDFKLRDQDYYEAGFLPGKLIGSHSLDAWGYRCGKNKGSYAKDMIDKGLDPWASWNPEMEEYCELDVEVNDEVFDFIEYQNNPIAQDALDMEQDAQRLVTYMEHTGFPFNEPEGRELAEKLEEAFNAKVASICENVCGKYVAVKKHRVAPDYKDPDGYWTLKTYKKPRKKFGEDKSRAWWADVHVSKRTTKSKDPTKRGDTTEGAFYSKIEWQDFKPTSRNQIIDHFYTEYDWKPQEWTDKGNPKVDDTTLRALADKIPIANDLADVFLLQKILGYLQSGQEAWLKKYNADTGCIHPYTNIGGTVTGRCSHHGPNIGQVPSVETKKIDGVETVIRGIEGGYGYECRELFYVPRIVNGKPWVQAGVDLSGIEFRMLAECTAKYDNGAMIDVILSGQDVHQYHMNKTGINDRSIMKRGTYGLMYGGGNPKLGATIAPDADPEDWEKIGRRFRAQLMQGLPALDSVIQEIQEEAKGGTIKGLDGRDIFVRSPHSALNTKLQSMAAIVAKRWLVFTEDFCLEAGLDHGWEGDFAMLAFVHDEIQSGVRKKYAKRYIKLCIEAAKEAGLSLGLRCPVDAEGKIGHNWAECH